ncbi:hypothetical protein [Methylobacterium soli]|uniref:hypothetical protein n=1 Tax=Methylobacterium soli TaxID=553447 RepID=UPI00177B5B37|nr:hypothetical protein [Methylobacterium soli]GJE43127.1 hypothetical protein AEGHOMDF_2306 [Methylobacterium soli]
MPIITELKPTTAQAHSLTSTAVAEPEAAWKPQPCGLTREELREIVLDVLG